MPEQGPAATRIAGDQHDRPRADLRRVSCAALETRHSFQPQHPAADVLTSAPGRRKTLRAKRKGPLNSWDARWCSVRTTDESRYGAYSVSSCPIGPARRRTRRRGLRFGEVPVRRAGRLKRPRPDRPHATTWVPGARLRRRLRTKEAPQVVWRGKNSLPGHDYVCGTNGLGPISLIFTLHDSIKRQVYRKLARGVLSPLGDRHQLAPDQRALNRSSN